VFPLARLGSKAPAPARLLRARARPTFGPGSVEDKRGDDLASAGSVQVHVWVCKCKWKVMCMCGDVSASECRVRVASASECRV
jgi:hypothetical protein